MFHPTIILSFAIIFVLVAIGNSQSLTCQQYLLSLQNLYVNDHDQFKAQIFPYLLFSGKGIDDLGYPGSCQNDSSKYSYSTVQLQFTPNKTTFTGYMGLCFTNECTVNDLNFGGHFIIDYILDDYDFKIDSLFIQPQLNLQFSPLALSLGLVFGLFVILGMLSPIRAWVKLCMASDQQQYTIKTTYINLDSGKSSYDEEEAVQMEPIIKKISIRQKWKDIWKGEQSTKIYCFSVFRIAALPLIIYGQLFYQANKAAFNQSAFDNSVYQRFYSKLAMFAYYIPDIFFLISGYLFTKKLLKIDSDLIQNPYLHTIKFVGLRVFRLYPIYLSVFIIYWCITPALHCGPVWYVYQQQVSICDSSWWKVLLMIDNWFTSGCYPMLWFVQAQVQFTIVIGIFFIIYFTHRQTSLVVFILMLIASFLLQMLLSAELPTNLQTVLSQQSMLFFKSFYSHLFFYLWGSMLALLSSNTYIRDVIQQNVLENVIFMGCLALFSAGLIILVILCPWIWGSDSALSFELSACRMGMIVAFTLIFLNGMFRQNRKVHDSVIHKLGYYVYPMILCSQFIMQGSFWSVSSFFYIDAINLLNNSIPLVIVSIATGFTLGIMMDVRKLTQINQ